ncbi:MAG: hypothetical protein JNL39_10935 [Opitutaceae bacterium]|nr:hypothetical protein [Opitutaceae bacterium]
MNALAHRPSSCGRPARQACARWLLGALALAGSAAAQVVVSGTLGVSGGGVLHDGDRSAFQETFRQRKDGNGGLDDVLVSRTTDSSLLRIEGRYLRGDDDCRASLRFEKFDAYYVTADYRRFRTFYDGSGGRFLPRNLAISYFDEALRLDRSDMFVEFGTLQPGHVQWRLRYEQSTRDGMKNSLRWGETNLAGAAIGERNLIPAYLLVDELREAVILEASQSSENANWKVGGRYDRARVHDKNVVRRNAREPQADRFNTVTQGSVAESVTGHGYYERIFSDKLRASAGGLVTSIDTRLSGGMINGEAPDAPFSTTFVRRQAGDLGFIGLSGGAQLKQYVGNANAHFQATRHLSVVAGVKYERLRVQGVEDHTETEVEAIQAPRPPGGGGGGGRVLVTTLTAAESSSRDAWNEVTEDIEVRYTRWPGLHFSARGQLNQGTGHLVENSVLAGARAPAIDRDSDYERLGQRYTGNATWYVRPGLTLGAQVNYRLKIADFSSARDNTSNNPNSGNRYPAYIIDQDLESRDASFRLSWRPKPSLTLATRYAWQRSTITTTFANLPEIQNGRLTRHIATQSMTWTATPRLYLAGSINVTYDQLAVPPHRFTFNADNNFMSAVLGAGYVLGKVTDLFLDLSHYRADNYSDNPGVTLPLNLGQTLRSGFLTWVRRQNDRLTYTVKYGYTVNRDGTYGGQNDFSAHIFYGKVQYRF